MLGRNLVLVAALALGGCASEMEAAGGTGGALPTGIEATADAGGTGGAAPEITTGAGGVPSVTTTGSAGAGSGDGPELGTGGGGSALPRPSPGCGSQGRPAGGKVYEAGTSWLVFPEKYDGNSALPVLFGFHGCGAYNVGDDKRTTFWDVTRGSRFETDYVVAIPLAASGSCFDYNTDIVRVKALYDELVANYCVDLDRIFGSGHSSGAGFLNAMLTSEHKSDFDHFSFRGIAPVSSWDMATSTSVATLYIQGVTDGERGGGNGKSVVDKFVAANKCSQTTMPYAADSCISSHDKDPVDAGCVSYGACAAPTIWCSHNDSAYSGTFHGIPCFYRQAAFDFFEGL